MNLANKITVFRIVLIPIMIALFYLLGAWGGVAAAIVFAIASLSDLLDGYVARKYKMITDFGKIFDPLADKLLVTAAMVILLDAGGFEPVWGAIGITIILLRELVIGMIRQFAAMRGTIVAAALLGKLKTLSLNISLIALFLTVPASEIYAEELWYAGHILFAVAVVLAVISLIGYFAKNKQFLKNITKVREVRQLNAGHSVAYPDPDTVFAVTEQYPQRAHPQTTQPVQVIVHHQQQPQSQIRVQQPAIAAPHNLINTITEGKLTKDIFDSIVLYVIATQTVSLNKIQEKFKIGYRIASDAIDKMEELKFITKLTPTSKRRILVTREQYLEIMATSKYF